MKSCLPALVLLAAAGSSAIAGDKNDGCQTRADAAATKLLAEARAARAVWKQFPGFSADVEVNLDGKVAKGTVGVSSDGQVRLEVSDPEALAWATAMIKSTVRHHLERELPAATPCAFA